jgi:chromosome segregation ATPase
MDSTQKFIQIKERIENLSTKKIRLEERFKAEKEKLEKLLTEITSKGYDPKKLSEIRAEKEKQLNDLLNELEQKTKEAEEKLNTIEV